MVCEPPYMLDGASCCLDADNDKACDQAKVEETLSCPPPYMVNDTNCCLDAGANGVCDVEELPPSPQCTENEILSEGTCCKDADADMLCDPAPVEQTTPVAQAVDISSLRDAIVTIEVEARYWGENYAGDEGWFPYEAQGSGFFISEDGLIMTNAHVVEDYIIYCSLEHYDFCELRAKTLDGEEYDLSWVAMSYEWDFALVRIKQKSEDHKFTHLELSPESGEIGDVVYALGAPVGLDFSVTKGILSQKDQKTYRTDFEDDPEYSKYLKTDAPINPGNSGGPMVDENGKVIGLTTFGNLEEEAEGFALQSEAIIDLMKNTYLDMNTVVDKTKVFIQDGADSTKAGVVVSNPSTTKFFVYGKSGRALINDMSVGVLNNNAEDIKVCLYPKIMTWSGHIIYKRRLPLQETVKAKSFRTFAIDFEYEYDTEIIGVYVIEVNSCETDVLYGRAFGPSTYVNEYMK